MDEEKCDADFKAINTADNAFDQIVANKEDNRFF